MAYTADTRAHTYSHSDTNTYLPHVDVRQVVLVCTVTVDDVIFFLKVFSHVQAFVTDSECLYWSKYR